MGFFGFGSKKETKPVIDWVKLQTEEQLDQLIKKDSFEKPVILFKHSTRCSISAMAIHRLENQWDIDEEAVIPVYLDLIRFREVSNKIANDLGVVHQSPQILIVKNGACTYQSSHSQIEVRAIKNNL